MLKELHKAIQANEILEMMYLAKDGTITKRKVKILKIYGNKFQAYCFTRKDNRTFIIEQVLAVLPPNFKKKRAV